MIVNRTASVLFMAILLVCGLTAPAAADYVFNDVLTVIDPQIDGNNLDVYVHPASLGSFTVDFGIYDAAVNATFTWSAPANKLFEIVIPGDVTDAFLDFQVVTDGSSGGTERSLTLIPSFADFSGPALPAPGTPELELADDPNGLTGGGVDYEPLAIGLTYRFSSFSATAVIPADYNTAHDNPFQVYRMRVGLSYAEDITGEVPTVVSLVAIPEPASAALLGLGGLILFSKRRR